MNIQNNGFLYLFTDVIIIMLKNNEDVREYVENSLREGLNVKLVLGDDVKDIELIKTIIYSANPLSTLVITDNNVCLPFVKDCGLAIMGYMNYENEKINMQDISLKINDIKYIVEELSQVDEDYFNLVFMRFHNLPLKIMETERTFIREMTIDDLPAMYELYSGENVKKWTEALYEYEEEKKFTLAYIDGMYDFYGYGLWLVFEKVTGKLIGRAGISHRTIDEESCNELGYLIDDRYQRQGYGYEVCVAILNYAKNKLGMIEMYLCTEPENIASIRLAVKLGFTQKARIQTETGLIDVYYLNF